MVRMQQELRTNFRFTSLQELADRNVGHTNNVWYTRVSKKVLYETPYVVTGGIVYTGLEKAPKLI